MMNCRINFFGTFFVLFLLGCQVTQTIEPTSSQQNRSTENTSQTPRVLVFSKTTGFRHGSIGAGQQMLQAQAQERGWQISFSEDSSLFNDANLQNYDVIVFLSTTGDLFDDGQKEAFIRYIQAGGGFVGIHSATDSEYDWSWYEGLVGAYFQDHPAIQTASINVADPTHPSTSFISSPWVIRDEWYNFRTNPAENNDINVLLWLDESTYMGGKMGEFHPIAWYREYDGGRSWYTAIGHRSELYTDPEHELFQRHVAEGIEWAANQGADPAPTATPSSNVTLTPVAFLPILLNQVSSTVK